MTGISASGRAFHHLDLLLRREILRLRAGYALSLDEFRGLYVSDAQVDALVARTAPPADLPALDEAVLRDAAAGAEAELAALPAWARLKACARLSDFELRVVFWAFAPELDLKYEPLYAYLNNDVAKPWLTVDLALRLAGAPRLGAERSSLTQAGRLFRLGILDSARPGDAQSSLSLPLRPGAVVVQHLLGHWPADTELTRLIRVSRPVPVPWAALPMAPETRASLEAAAPATGPLCIYGPEGAGRARIARNLLAASGPVIEADAAVIAAADDAGHAVRLALCGALAGASLVLHCAEDLPLRPMQAALAAFAVLKLPLALLGGTPQELRRLCPEGREIAVRPLDDAGREAAWRYFLGDRTPSDAAGLRLTADLFQLPLEHIARAAQRVAEGDGPADAARLQAAARAHSCGEMAAQAECVSDDYRLGDLVLPPPILERIDGFIQATRHRRTVYDGWGMHRRLGAARGLTALFTGPSGTGKTMAASAIAKALGVNLYRIELSGIVSKYIGETEKNLDRVFSAARAANCILFFDEADALFGKRSEVKDAHDRYANIECAYLLQKMERHDGIIILTTNLPRSIDPAFSRRIHFAIDFPKPDERQREKLWRGMFPSGVPLAEDVDFAFLARNFHNTGGEIRNIALDAALRAAAADPPQVTMALLVRAVERQMLKQGKAPTAMEFKQHFQLVAPGA